MQLGPFGQLFLRQAQPLSVGPDATPECRPKVFHRPKCCLRRWLRDIDDRLYFRPVAYLVIDDHPVHIPTARYEAFRREVFASESATWRGSARITGTKENREAHRRMAAWLADLARTNPERFRGEFAKFDLVGDEASESATDLLVDWADWTGIGFVERVLPGMVVHSIGSPGPVAGDLLLIISTGWPWRRRALRVCVRRAAIARLRGSLADFIITGPGLSVRLHADGADIEPTDLGAIPAVGTGNVTEKAVRQACAPMTRSKGERVGRSVDRPPSPDVPVLGSLGRQIERHWRQHRPKMVARLRRQGVLQRALYAAQELTLVAEAELINSGWSPDQAREMTQQQWAFLPAEDEISTLSNGDPSSWVAPEIDD